MIPIINNPFDFLTVDTQNDNLESNEECFILWDYPYEKKSDGSTKNYKLSFKQCYNYDKGYYNSKLFLKGNIVLDVSGKIYNIKVDRKIYTKTFYYRDSD